MSFINVIVITILFDECFILYLYKFQGKCIQLYKVLSSNSKKTTFEKSPTIGIYSALSEILTVLPFKEL